MVAFTTSDDISLNNTDWYIDVIESRDGGHLSPLTTVNIPGGYSDGEVSIGCGVIDVAGQLVVRVVDSTRSDVVAQSSVINVAWPASVTLQVAESHKALTDDLTVTLSVGDIACQSQHTAVSYTLQLIYLSGVNSSSLFDTSHHKTIVFTQTLTSLSSSSSQIIISCSVIDRAGLYQAVLISSRRSDLPLAVSNTVVVVWSRDYSLSLGSLSKSCHRHVVVRHTQPRCDHVFYTVRLLVRQLPSNNINNNRVEQLGDDVTSRDWRYVSERRVRSSGASVTLDCVLFQRDVTVNYEHCVLLISTDSDGLEHIHQHFCTTPFTRPAHTG